MTEPFLLPTALTEAFHSLKISEQPRHWEFKSAVDSYTLNLEWPKEAKKSRQKHSRARYRAKRNVASNDSRIAKPSKEENQVHKTPPLSPDPDRVRETASEAGGLYVCKENYQKSEIPRTFEREHKTYSNECILDERATVSEVFSSKKKDLTRIPDVSKTDEQEYTVNLAKNVLERKNEVSRVGEDYSVEQDESRRSIELSKTRGKDYNPYQSDEEGRGKGSNKSEVGQTMRYEPDEDETLKFKMSKFFEEENRVLDQGSKMSEVEEIPSAKKVWEAEDVTLRSVISHTNESEYKAHSPEHIHELGNKTYEVGDSHFGQHEVAGFTKSEKSDLSKHFGNENRLPSESLTSQVEQILSTKHESLRERSNTQKSAELKRLYHQEDNLRSSVGGSEVGSVLFEARGETREVHGNRASGMATPQSSSKNKRSDSYLGELNLRSRVDKVVTQAKTDLENIDLTRERRRGTTKSSDSVTSSSELSVSLRHVRYRRTQYRKKRQSSKFGKETVGSTTTESDIQTSSETSQRSDAYSKVSSNSSKQAGSGHGSRTRKPRCCCGQKFSKKEDAVHHVLFECSVSVCFRVYLDIKVNRMIDRWENEANRIMGREWWQMYRTGCFPDVDKRSPVLKEIQTLVSEFIEKVSNEKFVDKQGGEFVLFEGLESLP